MSERLPYEDRLKQDWTELPLPDEDMSWRDMKRRLEEDDDKPFFIWWRPGCAVWGLVLITLLVVGWGIFRYGWTKSATSSHTDTRVEKPGTGDSNMSNTSAEILPGAGDSKVSSRFSTGSTRDTTTRNDSARSISNDRESEIGKSTYPSRDDQVSTTDVFPPTDKDSNNRSGKQKSPPNKRTTAATGKPDVKKPPRDIVLVERQAKKPANATQTKSIKPDESTVLPNNGADNNKLQQVDSIAKGDSISKESKTPQKDTATKNTPAAAETAKSKKKDPLYFSAGAGLQQLIPIGGQKLTPYSSSGRKGSLMDYIPSVYARLNKKDKWFVQVEFKYGAPQYSRESNKVYKQRIDTLISNTLVQNMSIKLQKTFYHQLPVTFNFFISRDWSIGAGVIWNKFTRAVAEQDVREINLITGSDSLKQRLIISDRNDSIATFAKSYFHAAFETQYRYRRFSFAARYAFGLQPFINFTLPGGPPQKERNQTLQVVVRYELFKSGKK
jgi:hypothetical protein